MRKVIAPKVPKVTPYTSGKRRGYILDYTDIRTGKRERTRIQANKAFANKEAVRIYDEMVSFHLGHTARTYPDIELSALVEQYNSSIEGTVAPSSLRRYKTFSRNFLEYIAQNFIRIRMASQVELVYIDRFVKHLIDIERKPKTINNQIFVIKNIFKLAVDRGYIAASKVEGRKRLRITRTDHPEFWTTEEVASILEQVRPDWVDPLKFLYMTGLRVGEMIGLKWDNVRLDTNSSTINFYSSKTRKNVSFPLNQKARQIIQRQTRSQRHDNVFTGPNGGVIKYDDIHHRLDEALDKANLEGNLHKFRHTFATHLIQKNVSIVVVSRLLAHSSIEMTAIYAQTSEEHLFAAVEKLIE